MENNVSSSRVNSSNAIASQCNSGFSLARLTIIIGAVMVLLRLMRERKAMSFRAKVVIITGGGRGLGLNLARKLVAEGARVALVARSESELQRAAAELKAMGGDVFTIVADVTKEGAAQNIVHAVVKHFGALDVLINSAGIMTFGPQEHMSKADYHAAMDLHLFAPLNLIQAATPYLKKSKTARIVNITSFGGLVAIPYMAAYTASKFAQVGLSDALRSELAKDGISVTTVCPGIMRTGSHLAINFKGNQKPEYTLFKLGVGIPGVATSAPQAAKLIVEATRHGDPSLVFPLPILGLSILTRVFPNTTGLVLGLVSRFLPKPTDESGDEAQAGHDLEPVLPSSILTKLADRAAVENNELNGHAMSKSKA
jgi:NAD(P)-dependent dehydrogenase (short-subunit alcohol dehydrogenase family)